MTEMTAEPGHIVTFYSYKGGCGRTMALANTAWILASNGKRVLTVDWDLEAPGLDKFYRPFIDSGALSEHLGVSFLITNYEAAIINATGNRDQPRGGRRVAPSVIAGQHTRLADHVTPVRWDFPSGGRLDFLPAGASNRDYGTGMSGFDWDKFMQAYHGDEFIEALRSAMRRDYDYTLIDSRTGMNDSGDLCTAMLPDTLVIGFALSDQSLEGASDVAQRVTGYDLDSAIRILPVPMRVEDSETDKKDAGLAKAQALFQRYVPAKAPHEYWGKVQIPYKTFYAYEEVLAGFGDRPAQPGSLLAAFERLTDEISHGTVTTLPPLPEEERTEFLRTRFTRRKPEALAEILLSFISEDRPWAEWITAVLESNGLRVKTQRDAETTAADALATAVKSAKRTIALISEAYRTSAECADLLSALHQADPGKTRGLVTPCRVDASSIEPVFPTRTLVELDQLDQATALRQLSRALDVPLRATEGLRYPGAKPDVWLVPERNPNFTGRAKIIDALREQMRAGKATSVQVLHASAGFGKTQIAMEYADRFKSSYDIVWWIRSEEPNRVVEALAQLGSKLGLRGANDVATVELVKEALRRGEPLKRALLMFDNVPRAETIEGMLPTGGDTHILITTRDRAVAGDGQATLNIEGFAREESIALLLRHVPEMAHQDADHLAAALSDVPIDIDAAGRYIHQTAVTVDGYLARVPVQVRGSVWLAAIEQVESISPAAVRMMELFAYFGGDPVDRAILYSDQFAQVLADYDPSLSIDRELLGDYAAALNRFGLLRIDQVHGFTMHRALQDFLRPRLVEQGVAEQARTSVQRILALSRPTSGDTDDPENRAAFARIWPHLNACGAEQSTDPRVRLLLMDEVRHLWLTGQLAEAEQIARNLVTIWSAHSGEGDRTVLRLRFLLANVLRNIGRAEESYEIDTDVAEKQLAILSGKNHPERLNTLASVGADLRAMGRFGDALEVDHECYEVTRKSTEHGRTAMRAAHNYALSLAVTGACFQARDLNRQLYDEQKTILDYGHPWTLNTAINLGRDLRDCGDYAGSIRLLEAVLRRCRERRGARDPYTLESAKGLAVALRKAGRHAEGLDETEKVVEHFEAVFGPNGAETLACKLNLACDLSAVGQRQRALEAATEMHHQYQNLLGSRHPHTLAAANNVAIYLRTTGRAKESRNLAATTFAGLTDVLGADHPFTLYCGVNLANAAADYNLLDQAVGQLDEILPVLAAVLGAEHPSTLVAAANRSVVRHRQGLKADAEATRAKALEPLTALLGAEHETIRTFMEWRLANRDLEPYRT